MKKVIVLGIVLTMVMVFAAGASAFIIKAGCANTDGTAASANGQISNESDGFLALGPALVPEATYALYVNNNTAADATLHTLKIKSSGPEFTYFGVVNGRGGYTGAFDLRFFSTTSAAKLAAGEWYLYKGHGTKGQLLDKATFGINESTWAASTFGAVLKAGDTWTLSNVNVVPEPGSIVAMLSGLAGLAGFGIRRRK